jgi:Flp pilus assembly protein TadD
VEAAPLPEPSTSVPTDSDASHALSEESARQLIRTARSLLEAGQIRAGVAAARQALAANSTDAEPYILLAAGLQDLGDWAGAQAIFGACKERSHQGPSADCRYFSQSTLAQRK